jgi:hypothetical protein
VTTFAESDLSRDRDDPTTEESLVQFLGDLLQLIEEAAPAELIRAARAKLGGVVRSETALTDGERALERALRIRDSLVDQRAREIELRTLIDTAADLSALTDLNEVLAAICRRVRSVLGTDAAWITLVDRERGDTYHCMTDGIAADEEVRGFRLSAGTGLGGLVLKTGHAQWTDDYLTDQRFTHSPPIDRSARNEGLTAMLGAPMKRGEELLGIVITGNRSHKRFAAREVALLQTLADFAAIAIANARQLSTSLGASEALANNYESLQRRTEATARIAELHMHLSHLVLAGTSLQELANHLGVSVNGELIVIDVDRRVLATSSGTSGESVLEILAATELEHVLADDEPLTVLGATGAPSRLFVPLRSKTEPLGVLCLTKLALQGSDLPSLQAGALPIALFLTHERAQADAERVGRGELLDDLMSSKSLSPNVLTRRADRVGWDPDDSYVVVVLDSGPVDAHRVRLAGGRLAAERRGLMTEREEKLVLLLPAASPEALLPDLARAFPAHEGGRPTLAVSRATSGAKQIPATHAETQQALALALALGHAGSVVFAEQTNALGIILGSTQPNELAAFIDRTLGAVLQHDRQRRSDLIPTLEAWFACDGHMGRTASAAHIHVNTLYKRMSRIDELLGEGWREPDARLQIQLALRLRQLAAAFDPPPVSAR